MDQCLPVEERAETLRQLFTQLEARVGQVQQDARQDVQATHEVMDSAAARCPHGTGPELRGACRQPNGGGR
jgi:hypothetical protein